MVISLTDQKPYTWSIFDPAVYEIDNAANDDVLRANACVFGRVVELVCRGGCGFG